MTAELGQFALFLAFAASLAQSALLLAATRPDGEAWNAAGRHAAVAASLLVVFSGAMFVAAFVSHDASLRAVAAYSHASLPLAYRAAAAWSSPPGAMLLGSVALAGWTLAWRASSPAEPPRLVGDALGLLGVVQSALLAAVILAAAPFAGRAAILAPGPGLEPQLQDPALLAHLPLLALGAAGLAVAFAVAAAVLLARDAEPAWARASRPWVLAAWVFLSAGIGVGSHWADREAGWGGWLPWERLPATQLVAWLAATTLLHLLPAAERGGPLLRWTARLALLPFPLVLLGAWLLRASPVPAAFPYANDPGLAGPHLALFAVAAGGALALAARRAPVPSGASGFEMISREAALAANALVLLSALAAVLLGLLQPFVAQGAGPANGVGPSYYDAVFVTLVIPGLALMGPAPGLRWGSESAGQAARESWRPAVAGLAAVTVAALLLERLTALMVTGLFLSAWIAWHALSGLVRSLRGARDAGSTAGHVAHLGVALLVAGATLSGGLEQAAEVAVAPGATESAGLLRLRAGSARETEGANYRAVRLRVFLREDAREIALEPEARIYHAGGLPTAEPAIHRNLAREVHVAIAGTAGAGAWVLRVRVRPFMSLVWGGMLLIVAGGLLAVARRIALARSESRPSPVRAPPALALGGTP
ncbi:MAG: hypothetical protein FIB05_06445 [Betaproteobacteria bacterium]|nr:hypothetical protein [Betaproteobacteria bacterium]PWB61700.1 MAG: hypothetical protein C3F16_07970 [Betaproteobacteria bacterium]